MALLNPVYAFIVPFLFVVTVPLAVFAGITTTVAFSVLILRVLAVYLDVAISLIPHYLGGHKPRPYHPHPPRLEALNAITTHFSSSSNSTASNTPLRRRRRRRSSSAISGTSLTPAASETALGLLPSIGPERDFEGVGGWRVADDDGWTTINSRLELPDKHHARSSHRPPSGPTTPGEGPCLMMKSRAPSPETKRTSASPNSSRTRTPSGPRIAFATKPLVDSYFPMLTASPKTSKKPGQGMVEI